MQTTVSAVPDTSISRLIALAMRGLESMYDSDKRLFCYRLQKTRSGMIREGISHRYTMMTLLGLLRAKSAGLCVSIDVEATVNQLLADSTWVDNIGDLGLLLWLCAVVSEKHQKQFYATFDVLRALDRYRDAQHRLTMELSWFLIGLAHASTRHQSPDLESLANETYGLLCANQGQHGLFGHLAKWRSAAGVARARIGSFADQVYPILAVSHFSRVFGIREACHNALRCAETICRLQGSLGQWWWHYDSATGRVIEHYPVYSVHQHAMAPMALFALEAESKADFRLHINKGLKWINGSNELQQDLEDGTANVVWRCIQPQKSTTYVARMRTLVGQEFIKGPPHVVFECRPYELGWLLYALAQRSTNERKDFSLTDAQLG